VRKRFAFPGEVIQCAGEMIKALAVSPADFPENFMKPCPDGYRDGSFLSREKNGRKYMMMLKCACTRGLNTYIAGPANRLNFCPPAPRSDGPTFCQEKVG
jgi:hypothetical protein